MMTSWQWQWQWQWQWLMMVVVALSGCAYDMDDVGSTGAGLDSPSLLRNTQEVVLWSGSASHESALTGIVPDVCAQTGCDRHDVIVDLPGGTWSQSGGVQFAVRWDDFESGLDLYVYRDGDLVGLSEGPLSMSESVIVPAAPNGVYTVYVVYEEGSADEEIVYEGLTEVEYAPKTNPLRAMLPDLEMRPPANLLFATGSYLFSPGLGEEMSCYPEETIGTGAQTCMRFDQVIANTGEGPFELRFAVPLDPEDDSTNVSQRIYHSDGSHSEQPAGEWELHAFHGHFHYKHFAFARLWRSDASAQRLGTEPIRDGRKVSFCMIDVGIDSWAEKGDTERTYRAPNCLHPEEFDERYGYIINGISPGWMDLYEWYLADQYINVTDLPDGYYVLDSIADPDALAREAEELNNCTAVHIYLRGVGDGAPQAEILGPGPSC